MPYYVTMTDKFMSGWGMAKNRTNKLVFICETLEEAKTVADNAARRGDQKYINIHGRKPAYYRATMGDDYETGNYYVQIKTREDYPSWYKPNYFRGE